MRGKKPRKFGSNNHDPTSFSKSLISANVLSAAATERAWAGEVARAARAVVVD
jgi:hypothetical protein